MKKCSVCQVEKEEDQFSFKFKEKGERHLHCKACQSKKVKKHYLDNKQKYLAKSKVTNAQYIERNRIYFNQYKKDKGCLICPENEPVALDFHHLNAEDKENEVARMICSALSIRAVMKEVDKCVVLCSNCHRKLHAGLLSLN